MKRKVLAVLLAVSMMATGLMGCGEEEKKVINMEEISDWTKAYDNYFKENKLMRDNSKHSTTVTQDNISLEMVTAVSGEDAYVLYGMGVASMELYRTKDKLYAKTLQGKNESWLYAPIKSKKDLFSIGGADSSVQDADITTWEYLEEVTENGIVYDKLNAYAKDEEGSFFCIICWVNRQTQKVDKYSMTQDGVTAEFLVEDIDGIVVPSASQTATKSTIEEISASLATLIIMSAWELSNTQ